MGDNMNKKQKNELDKILAGIFIFIGLFVWYKFFSDNWILFFVVIFVGSILPTLIIVIAHRVLIKLMRRKIKKRLIYQQINQFLQITTMTLDR